MRRSSRPSLVCTAIIVLLFACCAPVRPICHADVTSKDAFALKVLWANACCDATFGSTRPSLSIPATRPIKRSKKWRQRLSKKLLLDKFYCLRFGAALAHTLNMVAVVSLMVVVMYDAWGTLSLHSKACNHIPSPYIQILVISECAPLLRVCIRGLPQFNPLIVMESLTGLDL